MRLILKNLRQAEFEINVESSEISVKELKLQIENLYSYDSEQIKLIYKGSLLEDLYSLNVYKITENSTIIMMNLKNKEIENKPGNNNSNNNNNINKPIEQNKPKIEKTETKEEITDILKDNLNITINSLVDMGFEKSQVEIAVKAANGRIDLAIEYLNNGIPDNIKNNSMNNNNTRNKNKNEIMNELKKQASIIKVLCKDNKNYIFYLLDNIKKNDPGLLKLITDYRNEFEKLLDEPITEEDEKNYKNIETKADEIISKRNEESLKKLKELGDKFKEQKEKEQKEKEQKEQKEEKEKEKEKEEKDDNKGDNVEDKKENEKEADQNKNEDKKEEKNEKEEDKKDQVENTEDKKPEENKEKPQLENNEPKENAEGVKNEVEKEGEHKDDKVENNEEKINKENENENNNENNNDNENQLTEQDKEVISRLQNLGGFSYDKVFEAYIVCNKNEELTANYLFEAYN